MVNITINGEGVTATEGTSILAAAEHANIKIPRLCYHDSLTPDGACGICVVEIEGERNLTRSCVRVVQEGMKIHTNMLTKDCVRWA